MKKIAVLGSTGSIGVKTLEVIGDYPDQLSATALSARSRVDLLRSQIDDHQPAWVNVTDGEAGAVAELAARYSGRLTRGVEGLVEMVRQMDADMVVVSTVGAVGIRPTLAAIERGLDVALANKEVLVTAGAMVMEQARQRGIRLLPIDSEHNAVAQCLQGNCAEAVDRIILTASGGPFRNRSAAEVENVSVDEALAHPTWAMGPKITIDSATMMNKGFEVIEAMWLFDLPLDRIDVVIHPESLVHSMVEFVDGSVLAQMGLTDMYFPIQNVLLAPNRLANKYESLDLTRMGSLNFEPVSFERFPCLRLAYEAAREGGTAPAVLNAANEVAVDGFLNGRIQFGSIPKIIERVLGASDTQTADSLEAIEAADVWARNRAYELFD